MDYQTALKMFQQAEQDYLRTRKKTKADEQRWANEVMRKGTMADRIALAVSLIRESPIHCLSQLDYLLEVARSPVKRNCIMVIPTIAKIFIDKLLPKGSTLRTYKQFLAASTDGKKSASSDSNSNSESNPAIRAVFEQQLKDKFTTFLTQLETALNDPLNALRETALRACFALLFRTDEQSGRILGTAVSKLADQDSRIASLTVTKLVELATHVPARRAAFVEQLGHFLVTVTSTTTQNTENKPEKQREARLAHAQYLAVCCLNQLIFRKNDEAERQLATRIARLYFSLFRSAVFGGALPTDRKSKKAASVAVQFDSRLISALLTGMQRAFVYADASAASLFDKQLGLLFRIVHSENFSVSLQAFQVLYRLKQSETAQQADSVELVGESNTRTSVADRFYTALYGTLLRGNMPSSSKLPAFFNLVYKAVRTDSNARRVRAFVMRLLIAAGRAPSPAFACATLILISQVWKDLPHATTFVPEAYPAATHVIPTDSTATGSNTKQADSDSDEEHFEDVPDDESEKKKVSKQAESVPLSTKSGTWLHRSLRQVSKPDDSEALNEPAQHTSAKGADSDSAPVNSSSSGLFEGTRNPKFARDAELTYQHLLLRLTEHYHPSVAYFARRLLETGEPLRSDGDVFEDFALPAFLRRFVLKNPPKSRKQDAKAKRNLQNKRKRLALEARLDASQNGDKTGNAADEHLVRLFSEFDQQGALKRPRRRRHDGQEVTDSEFDDYLAKYDRQYLGLGADEDGEDDELQDETLDFADEVRSKMEADELDRLSGAKKRKNKGSADSGSESEDESDSDNEDENESDSEFDEEDFEDGENDEDMDADENTEDDSDVELSPKLKRNRKGNASAKKASLFADADEYAALIESDMNDTNYDDDDVDDVDEDEQQDDDGSEEEQAGRPAAHQSVKRRRLGKGAGFGPRKRPAKGQFMKRRAGSSMRRPMKRF